MKNIYACFVDFRKAFDSVWHDGLLNKLLHLNVVGHFYSVIKSLYSNSSCSIKIGQNQTRSFQYAMGVCKGCILSPLLFNLYLNDLPFSFQHTSFDPFVLPNYKKFNSLLYVMIVLSHGTKQSIAHQTRPAVLSAQIAFCSRLKATCYQGTMPTYVGQPPYLGGVWK